MGTGERPSVLACGGQSKDDNTGRNRRERESDRISYTGDVTIATVREAALCNQCWPQPREEFGRLLALYTQWMQHDRRPFAGTMLTE